MTHLIAFILIDQKEYSSSTFMPLHMDANYSIEITQLD